MECANWVVGGGVDEGAPSSGEGGRHGVGVEAIAFDEFGAGGGEGEGGGGGGGARNAADGEVRGAEEGESDGAALGTCGGWKSADSGKVAGMQRSWRSVPVAPKMVMSFLSDMMDGWRSSGMVSGMMV